jgi:hypothetical protein
MGVEYSYVFWLYIRDFIPTDKDKAIFQRSPAATSYGMANPMVTMDSRMNSLTFFLNTSTVSATTGTVPTIQAPLGFLPVTVDFVPLRRWVMLTISVRDRVATAYLDETIYTTTSVDVVRPIRPVLKPSNAGGVYVGRYDAGVPTIDGFIASLVFFNHAINHRDVQTLHRSGPSPSNVLARLGLPAYGFRSPIYRTDTLE